MKPLTLLAAVVMSASLGAAQPRVKSTLIDADALLRDLQVLSADDMQGRQVGTPGGEKARAYVIERFKASGIAPFGESYSQPFTFTSGRGGAQVERHGVNVIGRIPGTRNPRQYIVLTAHYDHLGVRNGQVFNGADDNASGTAALFALGKYFSTHRPENSLIVAALDGEEAGLRGAEAFVKSPPVGAMAMVLNVNMDMIGRDPKDMLHVVGTHQQPFLKPYIERVAAKAPVKLVMGHDDPSRRDVEDWTRDSDQYVFCRAKIPCLYFGVEDVEHHHKASDDYETMTHEFYVRAVETLVQVVNELDANLDAIAKVRGGGASGDLVQGAADASQPIEVPVTGGRLAGSLLMPTAAEGKVPVALLIAGSDPTDRDGNTTALPGKHNGLKLLAEALAAQGIASLRYDTRGLAGSAAAAVKESGLRVDPLGADAAAAVSFLRNDPRFSTITVIGHGEGALTGMRAARAARADAFVSVTGVAKAATEIDKSTIPALTLQGTTDMQGSVAEANAIGEFVRDIYRQREPPRRPAGQRVSLRDTMLAEVDGARIAIEYGRPSKRGRTIWGVLVPWGRWWMPGADEASTLTTSERLAFGQLVVPAGEYTIYTLPGDQTFRLIINGETGVFHTVYRPERDLGRVDMTLTKVGTPIERLTFAVEPRPGGGGVLKLLWDDRDYSATFVVRK